MNVIQIDSEQMVEIEALLLELSETYDTIENPTFLDEVTVYAQELPKRLRFDLNRFRLKEPHGGICLIQGFGVDNVVDTPSHWRQKPAPSPTIREDIFFSLCSSLLGDFIGWATQQDGYILHDILPIQGHEKEQLGSGSECLLTWHTEDAFHPYRTDYLGLMCLKNPDRVETTYSCIDDIELDERMRAILFQKRFILKPDESHLPKNRSSERDLGAPAHLLQQSYERITRMNEKPEKVAVLFGDPQRPYLRIDPYFMDFNDSDSEAVEALHYLVGEIDKHMKSIALRPGELLFLDNYLVVHGRKQFKARYDGNDRWLRRYNIAKDLRKSRDSRLNASNRIIF